MSKQSPEDAHLGDGELPPPYSPQEPTTTTTSSTHPDSLFSAHLAAVRSQMRAQQATRASQQDRHDTRLLALLMPLVEAVLASVAAAEPPPRLVEATLVPDGAVAAGWTPTETHEGRQGEIRSVVRVRTRTPGDGKQQPTAGESAASGREFDGWGRWGEDVGAERGEDELWWKDEDMAVRLARYLQPARRVAAVAVDRRTVAAKVTEAKKSRSRWNILGGGGSSSSSGATSSTPPAASRPGAAVHAADDVSMHVTAEEVTFRRENELGLWESSTGWGVVVRVSIRS